MKNFFELNRDQTIEYGMINGESPYAYIDNFFKNPEEVIELLHHIAPNFHKEGGTSNNSMDNGVVRPQDNDEDRSEFKNYNGEYFADMRHEFYSDKILPAYEHLHHVLRGMGITQVPCDRRAVISNCFVFKEHPFNTYKDSYWWPHRDAGYSVLVYLNKDDNTGTNVYECLAPDYEGEDVREHEQPWRPKAHYKLIHNLEPKYNRAVIFNGEKYHHGMNITDNRFAGSEVRMNLGFFFHELKNVKR